MAGTRYYTATSLDGYIADENTSLDRLFEVDRDRQYARLTYHVGS